MMYLRDDEPEDYGGRLLVTFCLAVALGVALWLGIIAFVYWLLSLSTEAQLRIGAGTLLVLGSGLIFRALYECVHRVL